MSEDDSLKAARDEAQNALVSVTRAAGSIASEDLEYFRASNPAGAKELDKQTTRLLDLGRRLLKSAARDTDLAVPRLSNAEALDDNWASVVEVIDNVLEKADVALDEYTGNIKKVKPVDQERTSALHTKPAGARQAHFGPKPQTLFQKPPTNDETTAFKPLLKSKPHAIVPLEKSLEPSTMNGGSLEYPHPYQEEIQHYNYPDRVYEKIEPIPFKPISGNAIFVDTLEAVGEMLNELKTAKEIAVDLEHHDRHSYIGLVSLMQISTREKDWIVDTLKPWREDLQALNEVFTDPGIVKVLHGSHMDIIWLQRDLGLYMVGLFDTYHAAVALNYQKRSLAWLLSKFANFEAQKAYQMADWRIRPLPQEFLDYARSDTHFLLYVYDMIRNELVERRDRSGEDGRLVTQVLQNSKEECLQRYERPLYDNDLGTGANGFYNILVKAPAPFDKEQFAAFRALHRWRDDFARREDESFATVMQNNVLLSIVRQMPKTVSELLGSVSPVSDAMKASAHELVKIVQDAKSAEQQGPTLREFMSRHPLNIAFEARKAERALARFEERQSGPSLADIINKERGQHQDIRVDAIVGHESKFWGTTVKAIEKQRTEANMTLPIVERRLQVPLPPLTAEIYSYNQGDAVPTTPRAPPPEHEYTKKARGAPDSEIVVVREMGQKAKRKAASLDEVPVNGAGKAESRTDDPSQTEETAMELQGQEEPDSKAARKASRKAERARKKEQEAQAKEREKEEAPFDYASAPSVLNAKQSKAEKAKKKPAFNPYAKSMDAPKGLRKVKKEIQGKTATFKN